VTLVTDPTQDRFDRDGRLLAYAIRRGGLDLNRAQLRRGWAEVYVYHHNPRPSAGPAGCDHAARHRRVATRRGL
jgi:endonuclease YncB( thermonuclease family)